MGLKSIFGVMKQEGLLIPAIDKYLLSSVNQASEDRGHGWNSPSGIGKCVRSQVMGRLGVAKKDGATSPRVQRIFDNGHHMHDRIQGYLTKTGLLVIPEAPVYHEELTICGHADGILKIDALNYGILELKSINADGFKNLTAPKQEHMEQAQVYMYCIEKLRQKLQACTKSQFKRVRTQYLNRYFEFMDGFIVDGSKCTKAQKIEKAMREMEELVDLLYTITQPINRMYVMYECKNTQDLKEYCVKWDEERVSWIVEHYTYVNEMVEAEEIPDRPEEATSKSCGFCRYCDFQIACWKV